jgi:hypothetical protein
MAAGVYNTVIEKGATFELTVTYKDASGAAVDLSGWTVRMQVRETPGSASTILTSTGGSPTITITGNSAGIISASISATNTAALTPATAYYDIEVQNNSSGIVRRVLQGRIVISPEVTR